MLHHARLESWVLQVLSTLRGGIKVEDSRIEFKRTWPSPEKAARRLAGHANAARGAEIVWIIGVDENAGPVGTESKELSDWWAGTVSWFDGPAPGLTDLVIHFEGRLFVALAFETDRAPYVVRNPLFGQQGGGSISFEVPWREGTSVRSASRADLIRLLVNQISVPEIEALNGYGVMRAVKNFPSNDVAGIAVSFNLWVYFTPRSEGTTVIPFHRCSCAARSIVGNKLMEDFEVSVNRPSTYHPSGSRPDSVTMERTSSELIVHGPGKCQLVAERQNNELPAWIQNSELALRFRIAVIDADSPVVVEAFAKPVTPSQDEMGHWIIVAT
jgi:hypothetical protein